MNENEVEIWKAKVQEARNESRKNLEALYSSTEIIMHHESKLSQMRKALETAESALLDAKQVIGSRMNMEAPLGIINTALSLIASIRNEETK